MKLTGPSILYCWSKICPIICTRPKYVGLKCQSKYVVVPLHLPIFGQKMNVFCRAVIKVQVTLLKLIILLLNEQTVKLKNGFWNCFTEWLPPWTAQCLSGRGRIAACPYTSSDAETPSPSSGTKSREVTTKKSLYHNLIALVYKLFHISLHQVHFKLVSSHFSSTIGDPIIFNQDKRYHVWLFH